MNCYSQLGCLFWTLTTFSTTFGQTGRIIGQLINKTPHGDTPAYVEVVLMEFSGQQPKGYRTTHSDTAGKFAFDGLDADSHHSYIVGGVYKQAEFGSEALKFSSQSETINISVPVYEPTTDPSGIHIQMHHMILRQKDDRLGAMEILVIQNTGDKTLTGNINIPGKPRKASLFIPLPIQAKGFNLESGPSPDLVAPTEGGFAYFADIPPEEPVQLTYTYDLSSVRLPGELSRQIAYPTQHFTMLTDPSQLNLASDMLRDRESQEMNGQQFLTLSTSNLPPGKLVVSIMLAGKAAHKVVLSRLIWALVPVGICLIAWRGASLLVQKNTLSPETIASASSPSKRNLRRRLSEAERLQQRRDQLLDEIAQLDDRFEDNEIPLQEYESLRAIRKRELEALVKKISAS